MGQAEPNACVWLIFEVNSCGSSFTASLIEISWNGILLYSWFNLYKNYHTTNISSWCAVIKLVKHYCLSLWDINIWHTSTLPIYAFLSNRGTHFLSNYNNFCILFHDWKWVKGKFYHWYSQIIFHNRKFWALKGKYGRMMRV